MFNETRSITSCRRNAQRMKGAVKTQHSAFLTLMVIIACPNSITVSSQPSVSPVISQVSNTVTFSWEIPQGGLSTGATFFAVSPGGITVFILTPTTGTFLPTDNYRDRVTFLGSRSSRNITFTMTNIQTLDAGTYICGRGGVADVISDCGQMLIVLGIPTTQSRPVASPTPVYNQKVTLTCSSTSTTVPADHGLTVTYSWQRDGSDVTPSPGSSYTFTVESRNSQTYRCRARESQGPESEWSPVYNMVPEYGPYQISLTPSTLSYTVTENQDTISPFTCSANCTPGCNYRWFKNGTTNAGTDATLSLGQAVRNKTGSYRCQPYNKHGNDNSSTVSVDVQYPPDVQVNTPGLPSCRPFRVYVGQQNVRLTCQVLAANPRVTSYRWKQNGSVISLATDSVLTISSVTRSSGGSYTCQGNNSISTPDYSQPVSMEVQYDPSVSVPPSTQSVIEGNTLTVTCSVDANPSASSIRWTRKDDNSFIRNGPTLTITNIQRSQTGTYMCTATNTLSPCGGTSVQRSDTGEITLDVQYKASISNLTVNSASSSLTVDEDDTVTMTCQVDSNPTSTIRLMNGSQELTRVDNSLTATTDWTASCRQRGNYNCTASNNIEGEVNSMVTLAVKCSPRIDETFILKEQYASRLDGNVTVSVTVLAYPAPTFTWSRGGKTAQDLNGSLISVSDISTRSVLKLTHLQPKDFGKYNVTVENGLAAPATFSVDIVPEGPPEIPTNVTVLPHDANSLLVAWKQEFNGGANQNFKVEYSKDKVTWQIAGTYDESKTEEYLQQTVSNLEPSTSYYVRIIARNRFGEKNYTNSVTGLTKQLEKTTAEPPGPPAAVIGGAVGGGIVVFGLVAVITVVLLRKRSKDDGSKLGLHENAYGTESEKAEMHNNVLYDTSEGARGEGKPVMEDNVLYAGSGDIGGAASSGGAEYAVVTKKSNAKKNKGEDEINLYALPQKKDEGKDKKAEKKKDKKKDKKDDKKQANLRKQKRGDVYENTVPGQFGSEAEASTYANAGFVGDENHYEETTGASANAEKPAYGRDEDGLLYVGIDFGNQKPSQEVHGDEDTTEYAGIAFGKVGPPLPPDEEEKDKEKE